MWKTVLFMVQTPSSNTPAESSPLGILAFIGIGFILYVSLLVWWYSEDDRLGTSAAGRFLDKVLAAVSIFVFYITIVTIRKGFEVQWGNNTADLIGIIGEIIGIAIIWIILSGKK